MTDTLPTANENETAWQRRDDILAALTNAAQRFLSAPAASWPQTVQEVIADLGQRLHLRRICLLKHQEVTATYVWTGLRYEWTAESVQAKIDRPELQRIHLQEAGFGRWAGLLYEGQTIHEFVRDLPAGERGWFLSPSCQSVIVVPVFVGTQWWGFIVFEDYMPHRKCGQAELDAFMTVAVTFGAAIRRKRIEEALLREKATVEQKAVEVEDIARFPAEDPSPVLRVDGRGGVMYANRAAEPLLTVWGIRRGQGLPEEWKSIVGRVYQATIPEAVDVAVGERVISLLAVPVSGEQYVNLYGHDVTRERELDRLKSDFISLASHQLRTPLTSMRWYSERLLKKATTLPSEQQEMTRVIHDTSAQLAELVNDLLNLSRIDRGALVPEPVVGDIRKLVGEVMVEQRGAADKKGIALLLTGPEIAPFPFDPKLIREVILNLLSNAIKYTPEKGKVTVSVARNSETVSVSVADTGMGIAESDQSKICERFYRTKKAIDSGIEGTGLGLSLAKMMVERCGGTLGFVSTEGEGSIFTVTLPLAGCPQPETGNSATITVTNN